MTGGWNSAECPSDALSSSLKQENRLTALDLAPAEKLANEDLAKEVPAETWQVPGRSLAGPCRDLAKEVPAKPLEPAGMLTLQTSKGGYEARVGVPLVSMTSASAKIFRAGSCDLKENMVMCGWPHTLSPYKDKYVVMATTHTHTLPQCR